MELGGPGQRAQEATTSTDSALEDFGEHNAWSALQPAWLCKASPAPASGRLWKISGIAPWKMQLSPEGMPAFCLLVHRSRGGSPICSLQGLCQGRCGGLDTLLAETSSVQKPFGNTRACAGLVELLTLGTPSRTKGRGRLASSGVEGVWLSLSGVP